MKITFSFPDRHEVQRFLATYPNQSVRFPCVGVTREPVAALPGFDHDYRSIELGEGAAVFARAQELVRAWRVFPEGWCIPRPGHVAFRQGATMVVLIRIFGIWWWCPSRVVYTLHEERRFGFAYAPLPGHPELGEEQFLLEWLPANRVRYSIRAYSRPDHLLTRLGYYVVRAYQRKFVRESLRQLRTLSRSVASTGSIC